MIGTMLSSENLKNCNPERPIKKHKIEYTTPKSQAHTFDVEICEQKIRIEVLRMKQSDLIWVGNKTTPSFANVILAMESRYEKTPITTKLLGSNDAAAGMAARLAKKLKKQIFLSVNVQSDRIISMEPLVEKALYYLIENNKDCF